MRSRLLPFLGLLVLLFLVLSSWWAANLRERQRAQDFVQADPSLPDAWSGKFILLNSDVGGHLENVLEGKNMVHYPEKHIWQAQDTVYFHQGSGKSPSFSVVAQVAYVIGKWNHETARLQGKAVLHRFATPDQPEVLVYSHSFVINPQEGTVSTEDPVEVIDGKNHLSGVGMVYNNRTGQLKILHQSDVQLQTPTKK